MDESKKKLLMIGIVIASIVLAISITVYTGGGGSGASSTLRGKLVMKCNECGKSFELSEDEYGQKCQAVAGGSVAGVMGAKNPVLPCQFCGKNAVQIAVKCEKCSDVFTYDYGNREALLQGNYIDRCPKCGFSRMEERMGKYK